MTEPLEQELARAAAGDVPRRALRVVAPDLSPDQQRAGALVLYETAPEATPFEAFFERQYGEWVERGQIDGPGAGAWDFGDVEYPYLSGRVGAGATSVELRLGDTVIRRPVAEGWFLGVFWERGRPPTFDDDEPMPALVRAIS